MANTYTQLYVQVVFAVKYRASLIHPDWEPQLHKYITGTIQNMGHKMLQINGMPDHLHFFMGFNPKLAISDTVREVKKASASFIKENGLVNGPFRWQSGYGAFSYSHSDIGNVCRYIARQKEHHRQKSFKEEYLGLLKEFEVEFRGEYLFDFLDDDG